MESIVINLEPNYQYWQEIHFANGNGTLLKSVRVKHSYEYVKLCAIIVVIFIVICFYDHDLMDGLLGALFFFLVSLIYFLKNLREQYLWREKKLKYFEGFKQISKYEVILSSESIGFRNDLEYYELEWNSLKEVERTKRGLRLYTEEGYYIIPQKAMSDIDFEILMDYAERSISDISIERAS